MKYMKTYEQKQRKLLYSAVVLTNKGKSVLLSKINELINIPDDWKIFAHHMTIQFGKSLEDYGLADDENKIITLTVKSIGISDKNIAVEVDGYKSHNEIPHITIAVNVNEGGKPFMSNNIEKWTKIEPFTIEGEVKNIYNR